MTETTPTPVPSEVAETTAGERCPRNPRPPHQRCENVVCDGNHRDYPADPRKAEARWTTPAEPDAGEVEALTVLIEQHTDVDGQEAARAVLASDWLAALLDRVRREEGAKVLNAVADEWLTEHDGEASHVARFLRTRAASVGRGEGL